MKVYLFVILFPSFLFSQVGIGTVNPTAELEINALTSLPALELNPQVSPLGTATGQISVIDDQLYLYDNNRSKWLSVESTLFNFGNENNTDNRFLEYVGDITAIGAIMPYDATITYVSIKTNEPTGVAKKFEIYVDNVMKPNNDTLSPTLISTDGVVTTSAATKSFLSQKHNIDVDQGQSLRIRVSGDGAPVRNPVVLLWVKWRK